MLLLELHLFVLFYMETGIFLLGILWGAGSNEDWTGCNTMKLFDYSVSLTSEGAFS